MQSAFTDRAKVEWLAYGLRLYTLPLLIPLPVAYLRNETKPARDCPGAVKKT